MEHTRQRKPLTHVRSYIVHDREGARRVSRLLARSLLVLWSSAACGCGDDDDGASARMPDAAITANDVGATAGNGSIGHACDADRDCGSGRCATTLSTRFGVTAAPAQGGYCTSDCTSTADCGSAGTCMNNQFGALGYCALVCHSASDCRESYRCVSATGDALAADGGSGSGTCQPTPETDRLADGVVGSACSAASDCGSGSCMQTIPIVNVDYPDGYCTGRCVSDDQCGSQGVCAPGLLGSAGSCYRRCDDDHPCGRAGYRCRVVSDVGRCIAGPEPLPDHVAGKACASDADCDGSSMSCASMLGSDPAPGGYCSQACAIDEDCGAGGVCINGIRIVTITSGRCLKACRQSSECRAGYTCSAFGGPNIQGGDGACTPLRDQSDAGTP